MVICGKHSNEPNKWYVSSYKLLYIGEAKEVRSRIVGHEKWSCWNKNCNNDILLKVAECNLGTTKRQKVECCLIFREKPVCNDECKDSFSHENDTVKIINKGKKSPLKDNYIC